MIRSIEEARALVAQAAEAEGRTSFAALVRSGIADDNPSVILALAGAPVPVPQPSEMLVPMPRHVDMGHVPNVAES